MRGFSNPIRFPAFNLTEGETFPKAASLLTAGSTRFCRDRDGDRLVVIEADPPGAMLSGKCPVLLFASLVRLWPIRSWHDEARSSVWSTGS